MYNNLFKIGPLSVHGYGVMIAVGILAALGVTIPRAKKRDMDINIIADLAILSLIFGFACAKLLYCIVEIRAFIQSPLQTLSGSGFVVYGGIIGGVLAAYIYCKVKKVNFLEYFDLLIPSVAIAQGFGRVGCFLAGCCYGRETASPIGVVFEHSDIAPNGVRLIPTQLFSSAGDFLIALILILYARRTRKTGKVAALYMILYSAGRFTIEFFRGDERGVVGILSTSQFISLFILALGLIVFFFDHLPLPARK